MHTWPLSCTRKNRQDSPAKPSSCPMHYLSTSRLPPPSPFATYATVRIDFDPLLVYVRKDSLGWVAPPPIAKWA